RQPGPLLWDRLDGWAGVHGLVASRRWEDLTLAYDARFASPDQFCSHDPSLVLPIAVALTARARRTETDALLACLDSHIAKERRSASRTPRRPEHVLLFERAQLASLRSDGEAAIRLLDAAVASGWRGSLISPDLSFCPAFDLVRRHRRFLAVEQRLRAEIAREVTKLRSGEPPGSATCAGPF
ncbi:MAG TPA: hypothetical protein VGW38_26360, partial [Chloroflexota bacterium]|nr:hypothetical protein [Chloroflexota bacterium]